MNIYKINIERYIHKAARAAKSADLCTVTIYKDKFVLGQGDCVCNVVWVIRGCGGKIR